MWESKIQSAEELRWENALPLYSNTVERDDNQQSEANVFSAQQIRGCHHGYYGEVQITDGDTMLAAG